MPRRNNASVEARKRIARELRKLAERVDELERELHDEWLRQLDGEIREAVGEEQPTTE